MRKRKIIILVIMVISLLFTNIDIYAKTKSKKAKTTTKQTTKKTTQSTKSNVYDYANTYLYLYPKKNDLWINIKVAKPDLISVAYPKFDNISWNVKTNKNGKMKDENKVNYDKLFYKESNSNKFDFKEGFYVEKDDANKFLEEKLKSIGFNTTERNDLIIDWLPILETNEKSVVYFEKTDSKQKYNKLTVIPKPDSLLRVNIHVKKVSSKPSIKAQKLEKFERVGSTAIECGGVIYK